MTRTPAATPSPSQATGQASPLLLGSLSLALVIVAVLAVYTQSRVTALDTRLQVLTSSTEKNTVALRDIRSRMTAMSNQGEELGDLRSRMQELKSSLEDFRSRYLVEAEPEGAQTSAPAAEPMQADEPATSATRTAATTAPDEPRTPVAGETAAVEPSPGADAGEAAAAPAQTAPAKTNQPAGPWVINLASTGDQDAARSYAAEAGTKGIPVEVNPAASGEREIYRLQVTGFASRDAARRYGETVKDTLNLKELWIFRASRAAQE